MILHASNYYPESEYETIREGGSKVSNQLLWSSSNKELLLLSMCLHLKESLSHIKHWKL